MGLQVVYQCISPAKFLVALINDTSGAIAEPHWACIISALNLIFVQDLPV